MKNPLIGVSGPHPWDTNEINNLFIKSLNATYSCPYVDYNWWMNGTSQPSWDGPRFYDEVYRLSKDYKMIWGFGTIPPDKISTFVPMILARYPDIWAVAPLLEAADVNQASEIIKTFRAILPDTLLVGPNYPNDYAPAYMDALVKSGAIACLDIIAMHDYFGCPGNGSVPPQPWGAYSHPFDRVNAPTPNLKGRIEWMQSYLKHTRQGFNGHKVILTEYGIYINDANDGYQAARICKEMDVPLILSTPNSPAYQSWSLPFGNGVFTQQTNGTFKMEWSPAVQGFLKEI